MQGLPVVSLFSGVGGLDLGLRAAGLDIRLQLDEDHACCETLRINKARYWQKSKIIEDKIENWSTYDLLHEAGLKVGEVALVSGGPPCQPFSKSAFWSPNRWADSRRKRPRGWRGIGIWRRSRSFESFVGLEDDRAVLLKKFARFVKEAQPAAYLIENVSGLAYRTSMPMLKALIKSLRRAGYASRYMVLDAADYGVPQKRERLFIIGAKNGRELVFPEPTHADKLQLTAGMAIGSLDDGIVKKEEVVGGKWGYLLPKVPPGQNYLFFTKERGYPNPIFKWRSKYWSFLLKLSPERPSWTIQARPGRYVGPFHWRNRKLRVHEIKRLQTFPDDYQVYGDMTVAQRQLGDAVPCLLAQRMGECIKSQIGKMDLVS